MSLAKLKSTKELGVISGCKCLIYGNAGTGKTTLLASAPAPVIISAERGLLSLRKYDLPVWPISNLSDLKEAYTWFTTSKEADRFQTVGIDSMSEIAEVILAEEKKGTKDPRKAYGEAQDSMINLFRGFRDIPRKHVAMLAKQEFTTDSATGAKSYAPSFPGNKLAQQAPYFFDEVFQLINAPNADGSIGRWLRTQPDLQNQAKDRSGALAVWENADPKTGGGLDVIFAKMVS